MIPPVTILLSRLSNISFVLSDIVENSGFRPVEMNLSRDILYDPVNRMIITKANRKFQIKVHDKKTITKSRKWKWKWKWKWMHCCKNKTAADC